MIQSVVGCILCVGLGVSSCSSDAATTAPSTLAGVASTTSPAVPTTVAAPPATAERTTTTISAAPTTTTTPAPTTTTLPKAAKLPLLADGLGDVKFGASAEDVITYVKSILGAPTGDSGWVHAADLGCPGDHARGVSWGDLVLEFGDTSTVTSGNDHFFAWVLGPPQGAALSPAGMTTPEGIKIGSTVAELQAAFPSATVFAGDDTVASSATISDGLFAFITAADPAGSITAMLGGQGCGE